MTTPHPIGELLRTGVRPTDEETEHLRALGGFVAEMYGRYLEGKSSEHLQSSSDAWSKKLTGRLAASTAERWHAGLGLAEMLLDSGFGAWWQISKDGFAAGYGDLDAEMEVLSLFEEEPQIVAAADEAPAPRRRRSLFGQKGAQPGQARRAPKKGQPGAIARAAERAAGLSPEAQKPRAGRYADGAIAELMVLKALAEGGLHVADQVTEVLDGAPALAGDVNISNVAGLPADAPMRWQARQARAPRAMAAAAQAALTQAGASEPTRAARRSITLDGLRVDERTPALATALERARAVFGANITSDGPALNAGRLEALTSAVKVSIDRGLGEGERPVYGFYDAVESTFLTLPKETAPGAVQANEGDAPVRTPRTARARAAQPKVAPTGRTAALAPARFVGAGAPAEASRSVQPTRPGIRAEAHDVSLDRVVPNVSGRDVRPFTAGVFATPGQAQTAPTGFDFATQIAFTPAAQAVASVQRGAVSAPRMALTTLAPQSRVGGAPATASNHVASLAERFELARAAGVAPTLGAAPASWRLAADGGADLPIGASFGRAEVFGAQRQIDARADVRTIGESFRPVIARSGEEAAARPSRLADAVDGLVWVSTPNNAFDVSAPLTQAGDVPMSAVPSGRRAAMVPAGAAFSAITRAAAGQTHRDAASGQTPRGERTMSTTSVANIVEMLRAGVLAPESAIARSFALAARSEPSFVGLAQAAASESLAASVSTASVAEGARVAAPGIAASQPLAATVAPGQPGAAIHPRWLDTVLADSSTAPALRASRWLEDVIAHGGYGQVDDLRVMLALPNTAQAPAQAEGAGESAATPSGRAFNRMSRLQARGGRPMSATQARAQAAAATRGPRGETTAQAMPAERPEVKAAREARQALLRPVMTAREARAAAGVIGSQGMSALANRSTFSGFGPAAIRLAVDDARSSSTSVGTRREVAGAAGSNEPVLSRLVTAAHAERSAAPAITAQWDADGGLVDRVARLGSSERQRVIQMLSSAGWTDGELEMLDLARPTAALPAEQLGQVAGAAAAGVTARTVAARALVARGVEAAPEAARVGRMGQSIARVMSGTEALGGNVAESMSGSQAQAMARAQASAWLPLLGSGASDKYFGGLAPSSTGPTPMALASLDSALGELVKMAEAQAAQSDTVVATESQRETLRRVLAVRGSLAEAARAAAASTPRGAAAAQAQAERAQARVTALQGASSPEAAAAGRPAGVQMIGERPALRGLATDRPGVRETTLAGGIDQALVERALQRAGLESSASAERLGLGMTERAMELPEAERTMVGLASTETPAQAADVAAAQAAESSKSARVAGLEQRLARALALSTAGPAGARRLTRALLGTKGAATAERAPARTRREAQAQAEQGDAAAQPVRRTTLTSASFRNVGLEAAAVSEELRHTLPIGLGQALAPEVMLAGLRSPELARAVKAISERQSMGGWDAVGVFTTLSDAGIDLGAARSSIAAEAPGRQAARSLFAREEIGALVQNRGEGGVVDAAALAQSGGLSPRVASMMREAARMGGATQQALLEVLSGGDAATAIARAGLGRQQKAGLLSAVLRGTERAERSSLLEAAGGSDFAFAWLARVDGTKSGLDIGLGEARNELGRTFGKRRDSALAESSPMGGASLVSTAAPAAHEERGGLRSVGAHVAPAGAGAAGRGQGASDAMRRTDWRFVETGSRASTAHADLGKLAAAIVGNSESGKRAPMPLVAPAAKAIAQTALRQSKSEGQSRGGGGGGGGGKKGAASPEPKLSEKAIEALAIEMANRVARLMGLMKERIGVW